MNKKTIVLISGIVLLIIVVLVTTFLIINNKKTKQNQNITITQYDKNMGIIKKVEIEDKDQIKYFYNIFKDISLEQKEELQYKIINNEVEIKLGDNRFINLQLNNTEYCYYENPNTNTKLIIEIPNGLINTINKILK